MTYILLAVLIWASSFIAGKYAYVMFDPAIVVQLRLSIAGLIVLPTFLKYYSDIEKPIRKKLWVLSILLSPLGIFLQFLGLSYTSASSALTIIGTQPILVLLVGFLFFKKRVAWYDWLLSFVVALGIILLIAGSNHDNHINLMGLFLVFISILGFAFVIYWSKHIMNKIDSNLYTAVILIQGAILCLPLTLFFHEQWLIKFSITGLLSILYLGIACSWLAYKLWNLGIKSTPAHIAGMLVVLEPVFGVLLAMIILKESMTLLSAIGSILVIGSAIASTLIPILKNKNP